MARFHWAFYAFIALEAIGCRPIGSGLPAEALFTLLPESHTKVDFANHLDYNPKFNIYTYRNFYNGAGVALGDIDNDGLVDIYFTANMKPNRLYRNEGNFRFEDITEKAGVGGKHAWSTGASMVDVNGDGLLDIYVCNSGIMEGDNRQNELFINQGNLTFKEEAEKYGVADKGFSTHAAFFDYDHDGDLDLYVLNNSFKAIGSFDLGNNERTERDLQGGDRLYRNDGGHFTDVSAQAGIYGSIIGFGLGVTVGDVDRDGWDDLYISNDFFERDYLYLNNHDGTFTECLEKQMRSISAASMGADMADINNDQYPEIFVTEMLPQSDARLKTVTTFEDWNRYQYDLKHDYYHQFTRNMLHLNNGDDTFSEIGRLAGVCATDWSWGALIFDLDNNGLKDIFVANGIYQDLTNQDYLQYFSNNRVARSIVSGNQVDFKKLIEAIPSNKLPNYAFVNNGNYTFTNESQNLGLATPSFSNGSAYGDLDNDGDLDLVVNNVNMPCFIYRNESNKKHPENHYLKVVLKGKGANTAAFGAKVTLRYSGKVQYLEEMPIRGFESSMDPRLNFGLGPTENIDSLIIEWPDGTHSLQRNVAANQTVTYDQQKTAKVVLDNPLFLKKRRQLFQLDTDSTIVDFRHVENNFVDFDRDKLLFHEVSTEGPKVCKADVNGDGLEDFYICGAKDSPGALFIQSKNGQFTRSNQDLFELDKAGEDSDCIFFDADGDGDPDLYVASGSNELPESSSALLDRLYFNDGHGKFTKSDQLLPTGRYESTGCVRAADYDGDGDLDLFVGIRLKPFLYGVPVNGYILNNDGHGKFSNVTNKTAATLKSIGMVTDAQWADIDSDGDPDLVVVGDWMPIRVFRNDRGIFTDISQQAGLSKTNGWWNCLAASDFDHDGDIDFVAGNLGLNSRFKASSDKPVTMYVNDFDHNGSVEHIICQYNGDKSYPMVLKHDLVSQIPSLRKKYLQYESYANQTMQDIFTPEQLRDAVKLEAYDLATSMIVNNGNGAFTVEPLPVQAQFSVTYAIYVDDLDHDGNLDMLLGGNLYGVKPEIGRYDASYGLWLRGVGNGGFKAMSAINSGFGTDGEVRDITTLDTPKGRVVLVARNNDRVQLFKVNQQKKAE